jgi:hypothetical protein
MPPLYLTNYTWPKVSEQGDQIKFFFFLTDLFSKKWAILFSFLAQTTLRAVIEFYLKSNHLFQKIIQVTMEPLYVLTYYKERITSE